MVTSLATYTIEPGVTYGVHPHHRNRSPQKSQWDISRDQELDVFVNARDQHWLSKDLGWGLHIVRARVAYLGKAQDRTRRLFMAKFVDGNRDQKWHGYPADHQRRPSDIPPAPILRDWMNSSLLRRAVVRKVLRGQPCSL